MSNLDETTLLLSVMSPYDWIGSRYHLIYYHFNDERYNEFMQLCFSVWSCVVFVEFYVG